MQADGEMDFRTNFVGSPARCAIIPRWCSMPITGRSATIPCRCGPGRRRSRRSGSTGCRSWRNTMRWCAAPRRRSASPRWWSCATTSSRRSGWRSRGSTCSCATSFPASIAGRSGDLTFDHVVPRARGGVTSWENVVAACSRCNLKKGSRSLRQSGLSLRKPPRQPGAEELRNMGRKFPPNHLHESWLDFLYWDAELDA
jgi:5-methylcytosine-specific restriction endonuclease McrA